MTPDEPVLSVQPGIIVIKGLDPGHNYQLSYTMRQEEVEGWHNWFDVSCHSTTADPNGVITLPRFKGERYAIKDVLLRNHDGTVALAMTSDPGKLKQWYSE